MVAGLRGPPAHRTAGHNPTTPMADASPPTQPGRKDPILAHPVAFVCVVALLWLFAGLIGHDPWKPEEAQYFGVAYEMFQTGDFVVPTLAGEPYVRNPPLSPIVATLVAHALVPVLPFHDAARLSSGLFMALTLLLAAATARELFGAGRSWLAPLALLGSVGVLLPAHFLVPEIPQLAGSALALYGFALGLRRPLPGGLALGTGVGMAFLAKGFLGPACLVATALALPVVSAHWRSRRYLAVLVAAVVAAVPWLLVWPALLGARAPEALNQWLWIDNVGRLTGEDPLWPPDKPGFYLALLPWFAFPSLPLAAWAVWAQRRKLGEARMVLPLVFTAAFLVVLSAFGTPRDGYALPLLVPLAILAGVGLLQLSRSTSHAFWWFAMLFPTFMVLMGWFEWFALEIGIPAARQRHWLRLQPGYQPHVDLFVPVAALLITALWVWLLWRMRRSPERPLMAWGAGVAVIWSIASLMFTDYVNAEKSYRQVVMAMARELPPGHDCISSYALGDAQRAMLHYFAGIRTWRESVPGRSRDCQILIVQGARANMYVPGPEWVQIWEGARAGEKRELFRLYKRG